MAKNSKPIRFLLHKITTEQFASVGEISGQDQKINLNTRANFAFDFQNRAIGVFTNITFITAERPFLTIEAGCHFQVEPEDWKTLIKEDETIELPR